MDLTDRQVYGFDFDNFELWRKSKPSLYWKPITKNFKFVTINFLSYDESIIKKNVQLFLIRTFLRLSLL